jgi:hypothetical protein
MQEKNFIVGSAGEQPTRNKIDAYTEKGVEHSSCSALTFSGKPYVSKNSFLIGQKDVPFNEVDSMLDC